jgi:hypothetical protein
VGGSCKQAKLVWLSLKISLVHWGAFAGSLSGVLSTVMVWAQLPACLFVRLYIME